MVVQKLSTSETDIIEGTDFCGYNCDKIQHCGKWGNACGVYGVKGKVSDIKKTFVVPVDIFTVTLDFIKIYSWYVRCVISHMVYVGINVMHE